MPDRALMDLNETSPAPPFFFFFWKDRPLLCCDVSQKDSHNRTDLGRRNHFQNPVSGR